jgi:PAS domain S-box-containing protein
MIFINKKGRIVFANKKCEEIMGYTPEELYSPDFDFFSLIHPEHREFIMENFRTHMRGEDIPPYEYCLITKDGKRIDVILTSKLIDYEGDKAILGIGTDITERKHAEENIKEMKDKYESLIKNIPDVIYSVLPDATSSTIFVSERIKEWTGYSPIEFYQDNELWSKSVHPEDKNKSLETFLKACETKKDFTSEYKVIHKETGQVFHVRDHGVPIFDEKGGIIRFDGILTDITERHLAEVALREAEAKYRTLVEQSLQGVGIVQDGGIAFANQALAEITGYTVKELTTLSHEKVVSIVHPEDQSLVWGRMRDRMMGISVPNHYEFRGVRKDGSIVQLEMFANLSEYNGKPAVQAIIVDITEKRKIEEELLKIQKLESLGILAGGIAHDFNNILTAILGNISIAKLSAKPGDKVFDRLKEAEKASMRAKDLTQQLLTFSKGGAPIKKTISLSKVLKDTATFTLSGSSVECKFIIQEDLWPVEADEGQISQVIHNLIINADQAMPEGGMIEVSAENITIGIEAALPLQQGNFVKMSIKDQGIGMPEDHLSKIFDPYFSTKQKGSGLGLTVAYSIIKNHQGYITADSELGVGTTFSIYLPASKKQLLPEEIQEVKPIIGKGKILVMDDEEIIREALGEILTTLEYQVGFAKNGEEAIALYKQAKEINEPFDAVIMDLTIRGGMGGKEAIKKLLEIDSNVKAIVSSGYSTDPVMADHQKYGFNGVVAKPYDIQELGKTLHKIIAKKNEK